MTKESSLKVATLDGGLGMAANSDSRLVLLVGLSSLALKQAAEAAAEALGWPLVDLNVQLAQRLLPATSQERRDQAWEALEEVALADDDGVVLSGTDILFEPTLGYRPYEALRRLGRQRPTIATWFGVVEDGDIVRASLGHPEYVRTRLDVPFVGVADGKGVHR